MKWTRSSAAFAAVVLVLSTALVGCSRPVEPPTQMSPPERPTASELSTTPIDFDFWVSRAGFVGPEGDLINGRALDLDFEWDVSVGYLAAVSSGDLRVARLTAGDSSLSEQDLPRIRRSLFGTTTPFVALRFIDDSPDETHPRYVVISPRRKAYPVKMTLVRDSGRWRVVQASEDTSLDAGAVLAEARESESHGVAKPAIYLYPKQPRRVSVSVLTRGRLTRVIPATDTVDGWSVQADPNGTITATDGRRYGYLFWEANLPVSYDLSSGFVVPVDETEAFLESSLASLGLNQQERDDFIEYWFPRLAGSSYNLIHFEGRAYEERYGLRIHPRPDTLIRVLMVYKPLLEPVDVTPQVLTAPARRGFTVVEWGGARAGQE